MGGDTYRSFAGGMKPEKTPKFGWKRFIYLLEESLGVFRDRVLGCILTCYATQPIYCPGYLCAHVYPFITYLSWRYLTLPTLGAKCIFTSCGMLT